ncbi:MAG: GlsB/YeaQ/YmgE family stress response membrane protein [Actinomycetota bacterium]|nr:GlsB/YeaQ/YmgE family stress response membrane protein [Actinomycetota bacterium]
MELSGILSGLFAGVVIGLIARILVPSMQPIGCFLTVFIGILGAAGGIALATAGGWDDSFWLTFITQIVIATILVAIVASLFRRSSP